MPRGGSGKGGHNNHLTSTSATPEEISKYTRFALDVYMIDTPDLHDAEQVNKAIIEYFRHCDEYRLKPGNMGLYACLGINRTEMSDILHGKIKNKVSADALVIIKKALRAMSLYRETLALDGKVNPVTYIFMAKNYDHMTDTQTIEHTIAQDDVPMLTQEDINKRIPVYSDAEIGDE